MRNETNVLYLCVSGQWRKLCSNLWGNLQAAVACRQLSQETLTPYNPGQGICLMLGLTDILNSMYTSWIFQKLHSMHWSGKENN